MLGIPGSMRMDPAEAIMRKGYVIGLVLGICLIGISAFGDDPGGFWPKLAPYQTGYLRVSPQHEIYYQLGGNPQGMPVMVLHGGPGAGCGPEYFRYFNPEKFHVVLHDQRGCGKSRPYGELFENDTRHLVEDIEKLRRHSRTGKGAAVRRFVGQHPGPGLCRDLSGECRRHGLARGLHRPPRRDRPFLPWRRGQVFPGSLRGAAKSHRPAANAQLSRATPGKTEIARSGRAR